MVRSLRIPLAYSDVPIIMMSAFCRIPCRRLQHADACIQKGECHRLAERVAGAALGSCLWAVPICCSLRMCVGTPECGRELWGHTLLSQGWRWQVDRGGSGLCKSDHSQGRLRD